MYLSALLDVCSGMFMQPTLSTLFYTRILRY